MITTLHRTLLFGAVVQCAAMPVWASEDLPNPTPQAVAGDDPTETYLPPADPPPPVTVEEASYQVKVLERRVVAFERPDPTSTALRLLYPGEVLDVKGVAKVGEETWVRIPLDRGAHGFVHTRHLSEPGDYARDSWKPPHVIRDIKPLGLGLTTWGGGRGLQFNFRYLLRSRLGISFSVGPTFDKEFNIRGNVLSFGATSFFVLHNLSPMVELGFNSVWFPNREATLRLWNFYATLGLEYMFDCGFFLNLHATYSVAVTRSVQVSLNRLQNDDVQPRRFGPWEGPAGEPLQSIRPGGTIGWSF